MKSSNDKHTLKPFEKWNVDQLKGEYELMKKRLIPHHQEWIAASATFTERQNEEIHALREYLQDNVDFWNEEELKFKFIGPLISLVRYDTDEYSAFLDRKLPAELNGKKITGVVDFMVATGKVEPQEPFFFLHEYKKERGANNDPLGQLLIAMFAAEARNALKHPRTHPMYGCYVVGRNWFFVVLDGKDYAVSNAFDATQNDIFQIVAILKRTKEYIEEILASRRANAHQTLRAK